MKKTISIRNILLIVVLVGCIRIELLHAQNAYEYHATNSSLTLVAGPLERIGRQLDGYMETEFVVRTVSDGNSKDILILKRDLTTEQVLWTKKYGLSNFDEEAFSILATGPIGAVVVGQISKNGGQKDNLIFRIDTDGNVVWTRSFGDPNYSESSRFINYIGGTGSQLILGERMDLTTGKKMIQLYRVDQFGVIEWKKWYEEAWLDFHSLTPTCSWSMEPNENMIVGHAQLLNGGEKVLFSMLVNAIDGTLVNTASTPPSNAFMFHNINGNVSSETFPSIVRRITGTGYYLAFNLNYSEDKERIGILSFDRDRTPTWVKEIELNGVGEIQRAGAINLQHVLEHQVVSFYTRGKNAPITQGKPGRLLIDNLGNVHYPAYFNVNCSDALSFRLNDLKVSYFLDFGVGTYKLFGINRTDNGLLNGCERDITSSTKDISFENDPFPFVGYEYGNNALRDPALPVEKVTPHRHVFCGESMAKSSKIEESVLFDFDEPMKLFPIPCQDILNIKLKNKGEALLSIYDQVGHLMLTQTIDENQSQLDVSFLATGLYMVHAKQNGRILIQKLVKE